MNKDDILEMSRKENKGQDLFVAKVNENAATISSIVATLFATVLFIVQCLVKGEYNLALYAVMLVIGAATFTSKAVFLKRKRDIVLAILFSIATLAVTAVYLYQMIAG